MVNRCLGTSLTAILSLSMIIILWKDTFLFPPYSETMTPDETYLPPSSGKYLQMGSLVRSSGSSWYLNSGSFTTSVSAGLSMALIMNFTIPDWSIPRADAIFFLVENRLPTALPPFRSVNRTVLS